MKVVCIRSRRSGTRVSMLRSRCCGGGEFMNPIRRSRPMNSPSPEHEAHDHHGMPHATEGSGNAHGAHDRHEGHSAAMFRDRFWITLLLSIPTLLWSGMIQHMFGFSAPGFPGSQYVPVVFGTAVYLYGGSVFVKGA